MARESKRSRWLPARLKDSFAKLTAKKPSLDNPPLLPASRPGALTPILSETPQPPAETDEKNTETRGARHVVAQPSSCLLFSKLPGDIRRDILILAFGKRALHMDLVFDHPFAVPQASTNSSGTSTPLDFKKDKEWRWSSVVCHRNRPWEPPSVMGWKYGWRGAWNDDCRSTPNTAACHLYPGEAPGKCQVVIMGFLLSCRQAYTEGVDVLYGTNTIIVDSEPLMLHMPRLILPQRLASITALELLVKARITSPRQGEFDVDLEHLAPTLDVIKSHFYSLNSFRLSLICSVWAAPDRFQLDERLHTVDSFYRTMQQSPNRLQNMTLELPATCSNNCKNHAKQPSAQHSLEKKEHAWVWRCFEGDGEPELQWRMAGNYPKPPLQLPVSENESIRVASMGYWIAEGNDDDPRSWVSCFGSTGL